MKSRALPSFWAAYEALPESVKRSARKAFQLWLDSPFHPSLHFKCIQAKEGVWSVRISLGHRALCFLEGDTAVWFWVGGHDDYEKHF